MKKIIVCGAGIGGMVSAILLAHKGYDVEIFEKNLYAGGKMSEFKKDGFRFDGGPSLITMPDVFKEFFRTVDREINEYFELEELESSCKYFWEDGTVFNSYCDENKLYKELKGVFGESEAANYRKYIDYGKIFYDLTKDDFLGNEFKIKNYLTIDGFKNLTKFISGRSVNDISNKFFKNEKLRQLMDRYATYNGSSPFLAPQLFSIIPYVEHKFGSWFVKGGIYKIAESLVRLCGEYNIKINYGYEFTGADTSKNKITSLKFKAGTGEVIEIKDFDTVVSNFTNSKVFMEEDYFENDDWSSSGFILKLGMNKKFSELSHHNILFSENNEKEFIDIFKNGIPQEDMTIYISISCKDDENDAPEGCENWFILVNSPFLSDKFEWTEEIKNKYAESIISRIDSFSFVFEKSIRDHILFCDIFTPKDFLEKLNCENGSIYGLSSNSIYQLMKRPGNKSGKYSNLYIAGGNSHPGGGVPLCFLSGKIVSQMIN